MAVWVMVYRTINENGSISRGRSTVFANCIASPNVESGKFFGPGMGGMFTAIKGHVGYSLEPSYDNLKRGHFFGI